MTRTVTLAFDDGSSHVYQNVPDTVMPDAIEQRARTEFVGKKVVGIDGGKKATQQPQTKFVPDPESQLVEDIAGHPVTRVALGAASPFIGAAQLGANLVGLGEPANAAVVRLEQSKIEGRKERGSEGFDWTEAAGTVLSPAFIKAAQMIPGADKVVTKILQGMGFGAAGGLTAPVTEEGDFAKKKATQTAIGTAIGAILPPAIDVTGHAAKGAYRAVIEPWANPDAIKRRVYEAAAGERAPEVVASLKANKVNVAGAQPTAGQAAAQAGSPEFSALQRIAMDIDPTRYGQRIDEQSQAVLGAVGKVAQTPVELEAAQSIRKATADPLYKAARGAGDVVDVAPIVANIDDLLQKNPGNRELVSELNNLRRGLTDAEGNPRVNAQEISSAMDGLKAAIADEKNKFIGGILDKFKKDISGAIPGYEKAQRVFAKRSEPINEMQVGQYLEGIIKRGWQSGAGMPLQEKAYLDAIRKSTDVAGDEAAKRAADLIAKRTTGAPRFKELDEVLTPKNLDIVNQIKDEFMRNQLWREQAKRGMANMPEIKAGGKLPNLLMREAMVMNALLTRLEGKVTKKIAAEIAVEMLNPPQVAKSLEEAMRITGSNKAKAAALDRIVKQISVASVQTGSK